MSGKGNASLNRLRSAVDVTMASNDDGTENVSTTQPVSEDTNPPETELPPPSQPDEPTENDDESDEDDIPFYQYTFSNGQVEGYGTPSPQALHIASMLGGFLARRLAEQRAAASDPIEVCEEDGSATNPAASSGLDLQEGKGMGKTAAKTKAAPKKKNKKSTKGSSSKRK